MPSFIANIVAMVPAFAGTTPVSPRPYENSYNVAIVPASKTYAPGGTSPPVKGEKAVPSAPADRTA